MAMVAHLSSGLMFIVVSLDSNGLAHGRTHVLRMLYAGFGSPAIPDGPKLTAPP
jgi:hypothetical protein